MGSLDNIKYLVSNLKEIYSLDTFIETGTGKGESLQVAIDLSFNNIFSVEIHKPFYEEAVQVYSKWAKIFNCKSEEALFEWLKKDIDPSNKCFFWLDAHFPSSHYGEDAFDLENDLSVRLPLKTELSIIFDNRNGAKHDVIVIDDLRMYVEDDFENGNWAEKDKYVEAFDLIGFLEEHLSETHHIDTMLNETGYLICKPKI